MKLLAIFSLMRAFAAAQTTPLLEFPETALDDPAAYEGYTTRFYRDSEGNAFQIYLNGRNGRVVHTWANGANESAGFTARDAAGRPAVLRWGSPEARTGSATAARSITYDLLSESSPLEIGWILLGSMRKERDFQYHEGHLRPFDAEPFILPELTDLLAQLETLPRPERERHLGLLRARSMAELRGRLHPRITSGRDGTTWVARVEHVTLDVRNHMALEIRGDRRESVLEASPRVLSISSRSRGAIRISATVTTDAPALTSLSRKEIFNPDFLRFYEVARASADSLKQVAAGGDARDAHLLRFRRLERQVRSLELLSYREKLMAGLPNFATYFGRDIMMTTLMMEPIWSVEMQEHVIASVFRKLSPSGQVSHEEALGGQAIRENAVEYTRLIREYRASEAREDASGAERALARARAVLGDLQAVRDNYHMIDDDFQLPVIAARYLTDPRASRERKRAFLLARPDKGTGPSHLGLLVRNLDFVATLVSPYVDNLTAVNLVSFPEAEEGRWLPGSWRDSRAGYAGGRFAMDVNAIWVPHALEAMQRILEALLGLGFDGSDLESAAGLEGALSSYLRDPSALRRARDAWAGAARHFRVVLNPPEIRRKVFAKLDWLPPQEAEYWRRVLARTPAAEAPLEFPALALDAHGRPIPVAHTDPATALLLEDYTEQVLRDAVRPKDVLGTLDPILRPYPVGLFVPGLGPLAANDAYASRDVWERFARDDYHSPRVVWGREVNLLLLGLARQILHAYDSAGHLRDGRPEFASYVQELRRALETTNEAVEASGLKHSELWSYRISADGALHPVRYGTSSDVQLWNVTDLAVRFLLDQLPPP